MRRILLRSNAFVRTARRLVKKNPESVAHLQAALKGELAGSWACSIGYELRIVFAFVQHEGAEAILLQTVGTHDEVY